MAHSMDGLSSGVNRLPVLMTRMNAGWSTSLLIFLMVKGMGGHALGRLLSYAVRFQDGAEINNASDDSWGGRCGKCRADERVALRNMKLKGRHQASVRNTACARRINA